MQNSNSTMKTGLLWEYTESNILPQKVILLQLHITCEKSNLVILLFAYKVIFIT